MPKDFSRIYRSISALFSFVFIKEKYSITLPDSGEHNYNLRMKKTFLLYALEILGRVLSYFGRKCSQSKPGSNGDADAQD